MSDIDADTQKLIKAYRHSTVFLQLYIDYMYIMCEPQVHSLKGCDEVCEAWPKGPW
jgi:hypothetical protein